MPCPSGGKTGKNNWHLSFPSEVEQMCFEVKINELLTLLWMVVSTPE